jgi:hypothetical protein
MARQLTILAERLRRSFDGFASDELLKEALILQFRHTRRPIGLAANNNSRQTPHRPTNYCQSLRLIPSKHAGGLRATTVPAIAPPAPQAYRDSNCPG